MAQFIQAGQMSPVQTVSSNQSVVQNQAPLLGDLVSGLGKTAADTISAYGDVYAKDKAQGLVKDEIENIDRAVAAAEKGGDIDEVPESVKMDQAEWKILSNAVKNGEMTQTRAKLLANSRLRSRIAEEPLFANKMRAAASEVIGFNIESTAAKEYFGAFPTKAQGNPRAEAMQKLRIEAENKAAVLGGDPEFYLKQGMMRKEIAGRRAELEDRRQLGILKASEYVNELNAADDQTAFGDVLDVMATRKAEDGKPIDAAEVRATFMQNKEQFLSDTRATFEAADGDLGSAEWQRIKSGIDQRYDGYINLIEEIGIDNFNEIRLDRLEKNRQIYGEEQFGNILLAKQLYGSENLGMWFQLTTGEMTETQRARMLKEFPQVKEIGELMEMGAEDFSNRFNKVVTDMTNGKMPTGDDAALEDPAAAKVYAEGNEDMQTNLVDTLNQQGKKYKLSSLIATKPPRETSIPNVGAMKTSYEQIVPDVTRQLGQLVQRSNNLQFYTKDNGRPGVYIPQAGYEGLSGRANRSDDMELLDEANDLFDRLDIFYDAVDNGWGKELGTDKNQLNVTVQRQMEQQASRAQSMENNVQFNETQQSLENAAMNGSVEDARAAYEKLQKARPEEFKAGFDSFYDRYRALLQEQRQRGE